MLADEITLNSANKALQDKLSSYISHHVFNYNLSLSSRQINYKAVICALYTNKIVEKDKSSLSKLLLRQSVVKITVQIVESDKVTKCNIFYQLC